MDKIKGLTRLTDVLPWAKADTLEELATAWRAAGTSVKGIGSKCDDTVRFITDDSNNEWQSTMLGFTSSLWGTSAWGKNQGGYEFKHPGKANPAANQPILDILDDVASVAACACEDAAEAARKLKREVKRIIWDAVKETVKEVFDFDIFEKIEIGVGGAAKIIQIFLSKIDQAAMAAAVDQYEVELRNSGDRLKRKQSAVEEGVKAAPKFEAEEARAEAFGARSLNEFKKNPMYTVEGDSADNHKIPVDLANQEGMGAGRNPNNGKEWEASHIIDKHVGQSDAQLEGRIRDQGVSPASTFNNLADAQKFVQKTIDNDEDRIGRWLEKCKAQGKTDTSTFSVEPTNLGVATGRSVDENNNVTEPERVHVALRYQPDREPPYVVITAYPKK